MSIRFICFILAIVLPFGIFTWVLLAGAVLLPYLAVILANAAGGRPAGLAPRLPGRAPTRPGHELPSLTQPVVHTVPRYRLATPADRDKTADGRDAGE